MRKTNFVVRVVMLMTLMFLLTPALSKVNRPGTRAKHRVVSELSLDFE